MTKNKFITIIFLSGLVLLFGEVANADINTGTVTNLSGSNNIPSTNPTSITLRWSMSSFSPTPSSTPGAVISSSTGNFLIAGRVFGTNNKVLSRTITPTFPPTTVNITETLKIPRNILFTAIKMGVSQISYQRVFTDCPNPAGSCTASLGPIGVTFNLTGDAASGFSVSSYKLRFENDQVAAIVSRGDKLKAMALINVTSTGTIRGVWEVATPASTAGQPSFRSLKIVQQQLNNIKTSQINSPELPTELTGIYLVRFRFIDPTITGEIPTIRYNVVESGEPEEQKVKALSPASGGALKPGTVFKWEPMRGANAYKLEIIELPAGTEPSDSDSYNPIAGVLVKANDAETEINKAVSQHLKPGKMYWWHVIGLNTAGMPVGRTNWASVNTE